MFELIKHLLELARSYQRTKELDGLNQKLTGSGISLSYGCADHRRLHLVGGTERERERDSRENYLIDTATILFYSIYLL